MSKFIDLTLINVNNPDDKRRTSINVDYIVMMSEMFDDNGNFLNTVIKVDGHYMSSGEFYVSERIKSIKERINLLQLVGDDRLYNTYPTEEGT